jgi:hypothetical protein
VFTSTPPLINFLLIPPALVSGLFSHQNPWATLSFMSYFSLFNLFAAYALLYMAPERSEGYRSALYFLLNPLTFGNSLLRRQDESILVFFFALALLFLVHQRHWWGSIAVGLTLLVKLSGALLIPVALIHTRDWRYLVIPPLVFGLIFVPFLLAAGDSAVFWDFSKRDTQHPFQFGGISPGALWGRMHDGYVPPWLLGFYSRALVVGFLIALGLIVWKPRGVFEDLALLTTAFLALTPKLHCGYFSILVLAMAPVVRKYRVEVLYFGASTLILVADMLKFPVRDYPLALGLLVAGLLLWIVAMVVLRWPRGAQRQLADST